MRDTLKPDGLKKLILAKTEILFKIKVALKTSPKEAIQDIEGMYLDMTLIRTIATYSAGGSKEDVSLALKEHILIFERFFKWTCCTLLTSLKGRIPQCFS